MDYQHITRSCWHAYIQLLHSLSPHFLLLQLECEDAQTGVTILTILSPLANVIRSLGQEKEAKLREARYGHDSWLSAEKRYGARGFFILYAFSFRCQLYSQLWALFICFSTQTEVCLIFCYFMVFFLSAASYCTLVSTVFNRALTAALRGCGFCFRLIFHLHWDDKWPWITNT